jgi:hypothetical protein
VATIAVRSDDRTNAEFSAKRYQLAVQRPTVQIREREILRVSGTLNGEDHERAAAIARNEVLKWAQTKAISKFGSEAWSHQSFEQVASGRSRVVVRLDEDDSTIWAIRVEDPDRETAGRIWTTEITLTSWLTRPARFTVRQMVGSPELSLADVEPHVPGVVRQIIQHPGLYSGVFRLSDKPVTVRSEQEAQLLIDALLDSTRTLPIIALSVPSNSADPQMPLINAKALAQACAGLAIVVILPAEYTWALSYRFGNRLSVYEGAVRIYLQNFTEDSNPFGGHDLILAERFGTPEGAATTLKRLRWNAALGSITRLALGTEVLAFASLRLKSLEQKQIALRRSGAPEKEQLQAATERIGSLEEQLKESAGLQDYFCGAHSQMQERAETAEAQQKASGFRIKQLLLQLKQAGKVPDENIQLPNEWPTFADWCENNLAGRVILTPQARRSVRDSVFEDVELAARCLLWLANVLGVAKMSDGDGALRDRVIEPGITNAHCGNDQFEIDWRDKRHIVDWHIKNGGNTREPERCLRIYYFWDDSSQQSVIASMPEHRRTGAS